MTWIPCSERMPPEDANVMVTYVSLGEYFVDDARWNGENWYTNEQGAIDPRRAMIIAWQPFPEPYRP